ncbi:MAG: hypothetical protein ABI883_07390, partial [Chthoniobacterales bacterium]
MKSNRVLPLALLLATCFLQSARAAEDVNPLLSESTLPYQLPPFDRIKNEHFQPAIEQGMAEQIKEVEQIASSPEKPTFENTIVALERTGRTLQRAERIFSNLNGTNTNPEMQRIDKELSP